MKLTRHTFSRAVRTFMASAPQHPRQVHASAKGKREDDGDDDTDKARRIASAMLQARRQAKQQTPTTILPDATRSDSASPSGPFLPSPTPSSPTLSSSPPPLTLSPKAKGLWESVASLAKSAYLIHLAHQHRYNAYPTHDLSRKADQDWAAWSPSEREKWIKVTPQGRRALQLLQRELTGNEPDAAAAEHGQAPLLSALRERYDGRVVVRRRHARDVALPQPSPAEAPHAFIGAPLLTFSQSRAAAASPIMPLTARGKLEAVTRDMESAAQKGLWQRQLIALLGREGAASFVTEVKHQQRDRDGKDDDDDEDGLGEEGEEERETTRAVAQPAMGRGRRHGSRPSLFRTAPAFLPSRDTEDGADTASDVSDAVPYTDTFLAFCTGMGVNSPRKVYIMQKLLPHLNSPSGAATTLAEVEALATKFSGEYDANVAELEKAGKTEALAAYKEELLKVELDHLQVKMARFQSQLPLLMRWLNVVK